MTQYLTYRSITCRAVLLDLPAQLDLKEPRVAQRTPVRLDTLDLQVHSDVSALLDLSFCHLGKSWIADCP